MSGEEWQVFVGKENNEYMAKYVNEALDKLSRYENDKMYAWSNWRELNNK